MRRTHRRLRVAEVDGEAERSVRRTRAAGLVTLSAQLHAGAVHVHRAERVLSGVGDRAETDRFPHRGDERDRRRREALQVRGVGQFGHRSLNRPGTSPVAAACG